jgi:hypothetical protein
MTFSQLYKFSAELKQYPIVIENVLDAKVAQFTSQDEIYYVPVDIDPEIYLGHIKQYRISNGVYSDSKSVTEIRYFKDLNMCWQRYVCCKELMHAFDTDDERTSNFDRLLELMQEIESPFPSDKQSEMFKSETKTMWMALAVLCPLPVRELLRPFWENGSKSDYEIALELRIPEELIHTIKADTYPSIVQSLID